MDEDEAGCRVRRFPYPSRDAGREGHEPCGSKTAVIVTFCILLNCRFLGKFKATLVM